jgi:hypothetical protein
LYEISVSTDTSCKFSTSALSLHEELTKPTVDGVNIAIWSGIEINVAIACASLPALKPLISRLAPGIFSSIGSRNKSNMNNLSGNELGSYHMNTFNNTNNNKSKTGTQVDEIKVEQSIYQQREVRVSVEGSERSLVDWKTDCFSEEQHRKKHEIV